MSFDLILLKALKLWSTPVIGISLNNGKAEFSIFPANNKSSDIDNRISHLESAKESLNKALSAIDELQFEATKNKAELSRLKELVAQAKQSKTTTAKDLSELQKLKSVELNTLKEMVEPSMKRVALERLIGFILGIIASLIASFLWMLFNG